MSVSTEHFYSNVHAELTRGNGVRKTATGRLPVSIGTVALRVSAFRERVLSRVGLRLGKKRISLESLEAEILAIEPARAIDELVSEAGSKGKKQSETAFLIGRHYMRLGRFEEARDWLQKAERQSSARSDLCEAVRSNLSACNVQLLAEGDACFAAGDFHGARERYARLTQGLSAMETGRLAVFLRSACVYSMLAHYEDANQALLHALQSAEETDQALGLLDILQRIINLKDDDAQPADEMSRTKSRLASHVAGVMDSLRAYPQDIAALPGS